MDTAQVFRQYCTLLLNCLLLLLCNTSKPFPPVWIGVLLTLSMKKGEKSHRATDWLERSDRDGDRGSTARELLQLVRDVSYVTPCPRLCCSVYVYHVLEIETEKNTHDNNKWKLQLISYQHFPHLITLWNSIKRRAKTEVTCSGRLAVIAPRMSGLKSMQSC